ncbi:regulatory iron-sulfur-containing complex subunit RicT [Adlercreutzia sp. ZJ304]|uniref:PSP1 domain-containing protein n=1 Tax=Adlercreutzia sp. ZJ304 TaxID=2709791 RepID=UPI0013EC2C28|nr:regulatory iron-sulfur-containing complex subunit RicT [Adlercreutzia sp. ZJ304]
MALVAPVNLAYNVHTLWFSPEGLDLKAGDKVVVETARGLELGVCASEIIEVSAEDIENLKSPLKPVKRIATDEDLQKAEEMERLSKEAMVVFRELARETSEDMHPVSVEYLLDGDKAVFYFESEARIDFRELVRKLAARFHVRIDMRQIGVRDEARIVGGLAHCGQVVCCKRLGGEFNPVSIRMAKDQDLSLNPQKISGLCGRLMCCLRYENEAYCDFKQRAPKLRAPIQTPDGEARVIEFDVPREVIVLQIDEEKPIKVPLAAFEPARDGKRPSVVGAEAWEDAKGKSTELFSTTASFEISKFTGNDKLAIAGELHRPHSQVEPSAGILGSSVDTHRKPRKRSGRASAVDQSPQPQQAPTKTDPKRIPRRRRSTKISGGEIQRVQNENSQADSPKVQPKKKQKASSNSQKQNGQKRQVLRPGHKSSSLSHADADDKKQAFSHKQRRPRRRKNANEASGNASGGNKKGGDK